MTEPGARMGDLSLLGGRFCLDFVNTVDPRDDERPGREYLSSYDDLVAWAVHADALTPDRARELTVEAARRTADAGAALRKAVALRETMHRVFAAVARGGRPDAADVAALNDEIAGAMAHARLVATAEGFAWGWDGDPTALDAPLWTVARSAGDLLVEGDPRRVRVCAGERCGWLFLDTSKSGSRRWCSMEGCGNRAKARQHYARTRRT